MTRSLGLWVFQELCLYTLGNLVVESEAVRKQLLPQGIIPVLASCIQVGAGSAALPPPVPSFRGATSQSSRQLCHRSRRGSLGLACAPFSGLCSLCESREGAQLRSAAASGCSVSPCARME